jgi:MoxR-like ATPase
VTSIPDETSAEEPNAQQSRELLETALFEIKRVIAGQDAMLERVLVCLLAGGHLLIEGVPGLAKTLTIKTTAQVLGGSFQRIQFTPDLVPSDLVGTRMYRPGAGTFETELGPVFCNFLLADEINRAPAKVQSALLEVMQEHQVTIGSSTHPVPDPFLVMATQNPIESEGTYPLPEAQIDRFMLKILVGYPEHDEELTIVQRSLGGPPELRRVVELEQLRALQAAVADVYVDPGIISYTVDLATATRDPAAHGLGELAPLVAFGASPRGPISLVQSCRALAFLRGRDYVVLGDVGTLAKDALRHRLVLSYQALAEEVDADSILDRVLAAVAKPELELRRAETAA